MGGGGEVRCAARQRRPLGAVPGRLLVSRCSEETRSATRLSERLAPGVFFHTVSSMARRGIRQQGNIHFLMRWTHRPVTEPNKCLRIP